MKKFYYTIATLLILLPILSCGGGGGGGGGGGSAPSAPANVTATAGEGKVTISWDSVSDATSYIIYLGTSTGVTKTSYSEKKEGSSITSPYEYTGLTSGTKYYFIVTASNANGESSESNEVSATPGDFVPCSGKPSNPTYVETLRLLTATSTDGLTFTRTNEILTDRASVPDAVVLASGRILVYYVTACRSVDGTESSANDTVVAVSDDNGVSWYYRNVTFNDVPSGATPPVDPNVVLKPDGNLRLFVTIDPDIADATVKARTYSFLSTDGGFTYELEGQRFEVTGVDVLDPENYRFSDTNWKIWAGTRLAMSLDGDTFDDRGIVCVAPDDQGTCFIVIEISVTDTANLYRMYVHGDVSGNNGIKSLTSSNTTLWTLESGSRLTLDTSSGLESSGVMFPTVVRLTNGMYLMVYQTDIP